MVLTQLVNRASSVVSAELQKRLTDLWVKVRFNIDGDYQQTHGLSSCFSGDSPQWLRSEIERINLLGSDQFRLGHAFIENKSQRSPDDFSQTARHGIPNLLVDGAFCASEIIISGECLNRCTFSNGETP